MISVLVVFGTRPEAIKMCPVVKELKKRGSFKVKVAVSGQHRGMLRQVLEYFGVVPDYDLDIMKLGQTLFDITASVLDGIGAVIKAVMPDVVLVHGDTTTAYAAALAAFYLGVPIGHVEAGLRTYDMSSPYPEEFKRASIALIAKYHFAPTALAAKNLLSEGRKNVYVTGNTVIDALRETVRENYSHPLLDGVGGKDLVLLTVHRRENLGAPMRSVFRAVRETVRKIPDTVFIYPVHSNPEIRKIANEELSGLEAVRMTEPLATVDFHNILAACRLVLTDSGGVQEEAAALGKPTLVLREHTEREEGILLGTSRLVGTREEDIRAALLQLLHEAPCENIKTQNPYGDGNAARRIAEILEKKGEYDV